MAEITPETAKNRSKTALKPPQNSTHNGDIPTALYLGDCLPILKGLPDASVDAVITDPPYSSGGAFRGDRMDSTSNKYQNSEQAGKLYAEFNGDNKDQRAWAYWCYLWLSECYRVMQDAAPILMFTDWRQLPTASDLDSKRQVKMLSDYARAALGPDIIRKAAAVQHKGTWPAALERARDCALDYGLEVFTGGQSNKSRFFDIYRHYYPKTFPVLQDYINTLEPDALLEFQPFADLMRARLPAGVYPLAHYLGATGHDLWRKYTIPPRMTYRQLLSIIWQEPNTRYALVRSPAFAFAVANNNGARFQITDDNGLPCLSYAQNHPTYYHEIMV